MAMTLRISDQVEVRVDDDTARSLARQLHAAGFTADLTGPTGTGASGPEFFDDHHAIWSRHTGGSGHYGKPEWQPDDDETAEAYYAAVHGKARTFLDLLIDRPGQRLSTDDIRRLAPGVFGNDHSIAGSVKGLSRSQRASTRRYPFYWWQEHPTRYAMKPGVAAVFERARRRIGG